MFASPFSIIHPSGRDVTDCDNDAEFELCFDAQHDEFPALHMDSLGRPCVLESLKVELLNCERNMQKKRHNCSLHWLKLNDKRRA